MLHPSRKEMEETVFKTGKNVSGSTAGLKIQLCRGPTYATSQKKSLVFHLASAVALSGLYPV
ncbi:MAG: hypothetical protein JWM16_424 [Verrucomicrobiales bacterium]|nr:hypothetical protein [Verrucomicrobiales bacterium]